MINFIYGVHNLTLIVDYDIILPVMSVVQTRIIYFVSEPVLYPGKLFNQAIIAGTLVSPAI